MIPKSISLTVDYKSDLKKYSEQEIFESVVAFANTEGGELYIGIENDGTITGACESHLNHYSMATLIANNTIPPISTNTSIIEIDGKQVLKIKTPKAYNAIISCTNGRVLRRRKREDGTYENVVMYPFEYQTRLQDINALDYSALPIINEDISCFDELEIARLKTILNKNSIDNSLIGISNDELFKLLGLAVDINGILTPTITGILLIGKKEVLKQYIPSSSTSFQVMIGDELKVNENFTLPLLATQEKLHSLIQPWNIESTYEIDDFKISIPRFNQSTLKEAIMNAYIHRDYSKIGRVKILINDEGCTITNPGGFINEINISKLIETEHRCRNNNLLNALKRIGLTEKVGHGYNRIYEGSLLYGKDIPTYSESSNGNISLFIPNGIVDVEFTKMISDEQARSGQKASLYSLVILNYLREYPKSTLAEIVDNTKIRESVIKYVLDKSINNGLINAFTNGQSITYSLSPKQYKAKIQKVAAINTIYSSEKEALDMILELTIKNGYIARNDVMQLLNIDEDRAYKMIKKLVISNDLELISKGKYSKYKLAVKPIFKFDL